MNNFPLYISIIFILTTLVAIILFYIASGFLKKTGIIILIWLILQTVLGLTGFYTNTDAFPPRLLFLAAPAILFIIILFVTTKGKQFVDGLSLKYLTLLHIVRIPVELVLYWLFLNKAVPQLMTFEGRNFDIVAGISASIIYYFGFIKKNLSKKIILIWNFICLALLLNIVINAVLSAPTAFQQFAFEQPNIAILYFPFNLLPAVVVPLVLLAHLAAIRQLVIVRTLK
jgi:hypothetical protein